MNDKYIRKAFDIGEIPDNIDLSTPPVTGFDYLYRVRLETRECPKVVVSNIDRAKFTSRQTVQIDAFNGFICARPGFRPDPKWQEEQLESFRSFRTKMAADRTLLKQKFKKRLFPKKIKAEDWCLFCLGSEIHDQIYSVEQDDNSTKGLSKSKKSKLSAPGNPPLLSIMLYLNQHKIVRLLSYHVDWMSEVGFSHAQGAWFYALLACLQTPLDPDTCALLRSLARLCSRVRSELPDSKNEFLDPLNLVVTLVAHHFDQKDMSDSFTEFSEV